MIDIDECKEVLKALKDGYLVGCRRARLTRRVRKSGRMYPERAALPERKKIALMLGAEALGRTQPREILKGGGGAASCPCCLLEIAENAKKYAVSYCQRCGQALKMDNPYMAQLSGGSGGGNKDEGI